VIAVAFLGFWALLGLVVFFVAMRGGPRRAREALYTESRRSRRLTVLVLAVLYVGFGIAVPALVLAANGNNKATVAPGGVTLRKTREGDEIRGRMLFAAKCATCHTLAAAHAVGKVGPNLDLLRPPYSLVLDAIVNGRARGNGQMPALLYDGQDARDVAAFVAAVAGQ
jgi:mono/diheme cytochrome c family protein